MRFVVLAAVSLLAAGCGYIGDPMPPALNIPNPVADLRVFQRGDKLVIDYTAPALTTETVGLTSITAAELRVNDKTVPLDVPKVGEAAHGEIPATEWVGNAVEVRVFLAGPKGKQSAPSNMVAFRAVQPLRAPEGVKAEPHPEGVRVTWTTADGRSTKFRVTRVPEASAVVEKPEYVDKSVELGKEYRYSVVGLLDTAESLPSATATVVPKDVFAPAVPTMVTALAGVSTIELAWERSTDADLKEYRVYRDGMPVGVSEAPSYSDKQVTSGQTYRYAITSVDQVGNESQRSAEVAIAAP